MVCACAISLILPSFQKSEIVEAEPIEFELSSIPKILLKAEIPNKKERFQFLKEKFCAPEKGLNLAMWKELMFIKKKKN